jgi:peroxiredoxin
MPFPHMSHRLLLLGLVLCLTTAAVAGPGEDLIERSREFYNNLESTSADLKIELVLPPQFAGMGDMPPSNYTIAAAMPNKFAMRPMGGMINELFVQDGEQWYIVLSFLKSYVLAPAVTAEEMSSVDSDWVVPLPGGSAIVGFTNHAEQSLLTATVVQDFGPDDLDGTACRHLKVESAAFSGEAWIATGDTPWVIRMLEGSPDPKKGTDEMMLQPGVDLTFSNWSSSPDLTNAFAFTPDPAFKKRETMPTPEDFAAMEQGPTANHESLDKPAPDFTLPTLDGGEAKLSELKGQVVVLDFWATWCKPCVMALPGVIKVTSELADQGVAFYAVNQGEKPERINGFLKEKGWTMPVALDPTAQAGQAYGVSGIPHTVIIDKKGIVRHVHSGFMPGMDIQLKSEIEALLSE